MKQYLAGMLFLLIFSLTAVCLLMNCVDSTGGNGGTAGGFSGFDPKDPKYSDVFGGGFDGARGQAQFSSSSAPAKTTIRPGSLDKSDFALQREKQWGTSAAIDTDSVDTDVFDDFRLLTAAFNSWDDIREFRVYVKLKKTGGGYYGGKVVINYWMTTGRQDKTG